MGKAILAIVTIFLLIVIINYVTFFWIKQIRKWKAEDRLQIKQAQRDALEEFDRSNEALSEFLEHYHAPKQKATKVVRRPVLR